MKNVNRLNRRIHKWLSLVVGLQIMIWVVTGLYFNLSDPIETSGQIHRIKIENSGDYSAFEFITLDNMVNVKAVSVDITWILGKPYYVLTEQGAAHQYQQQVRRVIDATSGLNYEVNRLDALSIARLSYVNPLKPISTVYLNPPVNELPKQQNPVWKVSVDDKNNTEIYIDAATGQVISHINDQRKFRDFMFKLHFMDYLNQGTFNNWFSIVFAFMSLILTVTGVIWSVQRVIL
jgi:hypothetical protein